MSKILILPFSEAWFKNRPRNRMTRSPTDSAFLIGNMRRMQRVISTLNSCSPKVSSLDGISRSSSSWPSLDFFGGVMPQHISWTFRKRTTSFLCPVVERWESAKIAQMSARRCADVVGSGGSGGTATEGVAEDALLDEALCPDVLRDPVDAGPLVARAGMVSAGVWLLLPGLSEYCGIQLVDVGKRARVEASEMAIRGEVDDWRRCCVE
jgi:hypothetical protein